MYAMDDKMFVRKNDLLVQGTVSKKNNVWLGLLDNIWMFEGI